MDSFDRIGDILDNIELVLVSLFCLVFLYYCFVAGIEKFGVKGFFLTLIMLVGLIGFALWVYDLTQGQSFLIQALAELVVGLVFYYILKAFIKGTF